MIERRDGPRTVLVLKGGPDAEREVSLMSGLEIGRALRQDGRLRVVEQAIDRVTADELRTLAAGRAADVIFPALHGPWGEGGPLQAELEATGLPYVGSSPAAAALAMDKHRTKLAIGPIPTPPSQTLAPDETCALPPPLVLKPIDDGSSVDLAICRTPPELAEARSRLHPRRGRLLAERYVEGRELTVGILDGTALPVVEIVPAAAFYDYQAKYEREDTRYVVDPDLPAAVHGDCRRWAEEAFRALGCRDVARVDFMLDARGPWFLELNTMPGFTTHSLVPMAAAAVGLDMPGLCRRLVDLAWERGRPGPRPCSAEARFAAESAG